MTQKLEVGAPTDVVYRQAISVPVPVAVPVAVPIAVPVAVPMVSASAAGARQGSQALAKLGNISGRFNFEIDNAHISGFRPFHGSMPVTSDGFRVATLMFRSGQKGMHLSASLVLNSGEEIARFERGTPAKTAAGAFLNSLASDFRTMPAAPVVIGLLGRPYGFFKVRGVGVGGQGMSGILDGTEFGYAGSSKLVASTAAQPHGGFGWKLDNLGGYKYTTRKKSSLGKKEAPLPVCFGSNGYATTAAADGIIHMIPTERGYRRAYFGAKSVLCEPGNGLSAHQKQDVLLMGAAMAAIIATEKQHSAGGM